MKSVFRLAFMAALAPPLASGQSVQNFIIDQQPPEPSLEKTGPDSARRARRARPSGTARSPT
jgi:hypothetical protein